MPQHPAVVPGLVSGAAGERSARAGLEHTDRRSDADFRGVARQHVAAALAFLAAHDTADAQFAENRIKEFFRDVVGSAISCDCTGLPSGRPAR